MADVVDEFESQQITKRLVTDAEWFYIGTNQSLIIKEPANDNFVRYYLPCHVTDSACYYYCVSCKLSTTKSRNVYAKVMDEASIADCRVLVFDDKYHVEGCHISLQQALEYDRLYIDNLKNECADEEDDEEMNEEEDEERVAEESPKPDEINNGPMLIPQTEEKLVNELFHVPIKFNGSVATTTAVSRTSNLLSPRNWYFANDDKDSIVIKISADYGRYYQFLTGTAGLLYRCIYCYENRAPVDVIATLTTNEDGSYALYAPEDSDHLEACRPSKLLEQRKERTHYKLAGNYIPVDVDRWFFGYNNKNEPETVLFIRDLDDYSKVRRFRIIKKISSDLRKVYRCSKCERHKIGLQAIAWKNVDHPRVEVMADPHYCAALDCNEILSNQKQKKYKVSCAKKDQQPIMIELDSDMEDDEVSTSCVESKDREVPDSDWYFGEDDSIIIKTAEDAWLAHKFKMVGGSPDEGGTIYKCPGCKVSDTFALCTKENKVIVSQKHDEICQPVPIQVFKIVENHIKQKTSNDNFHLDPTESILFPSSGPAAEEERLTKNVESTSTQYFYNDKNELYRLFVGTDGVDSTGHYYQFQELLGSDCALFVCETCHAYKMYVCICQRNNQITVKVDKAVDHLCPVVC